VLKPTQFSHFVSLPNHAINHFFSNAILYPISIVYHDQAGFDSVLDKTFSELPVSRDERRIHMTPKERAEIALSLGTPDQVPTFELEFQLTEELLGKKYLTQAELDKASGAERERLLKENAELFIEVAETLEYSIIPLQSIKDVDALVVEAKHIRQLTGNKYMLWAHADGTFSIPDGEHMTEFSYWLFDHPEDAHAEAQRRVDNAVERAKRLFDAGVDCFILCSDYCFNQGPFLSPRMFREFITPYLTDNISRIKALGAWVIKHTDGNIMPIIDQLIECEPHGLHSLDPMAGVDIAEIKRKYGDKVCLIGNVNCALLQTGTPEEMEASARYCLEHAKPGGGYIFSTSNCAFKGLPLDNYLRIHRIWKHLRDY